MTSPSTKPAWFVSLLASLALACADEGSDKKTDGVEAGAGPGGATAAGGGSGAGGRTAAGGTEGAGGYDPALALQCGADAGSDECRTCLAVNCCDAYVECEGNAPCREGFVKHRECFEDQDNPEPFECYPEFARSLPEAAAVGSALLVCILGPCQVCGPAAPL